MRARLVRVVLVHTQLRMLALCGSKRVVILIQRAERLAGVRALVAPKRAHFDRLVIVRYFRVELGLDLRSWRALQRWRGQLVVCEVAQVTQAFRLALDTVL